jgi:catechol 2,3-dioxygenase-like lactoylglutathione lyase family enzyme
MIAYVAFLVREYDEAIAYFTEKLGFTLLEDTAMGEGKRWVRVAPADASGNPPAGCSSSFAATTSGGTTRACARAA